MSLKGDGLTQCAQKYPCWGWGPLTEELRDNFWTIFSTDINAAYLLFSRGECVGVCVRW